MFLKIKSNFIVVVLLLVVSVSLFSCEEEQEMKYPTQLFRPVAFSIDAYHSPGGISLTWIPIKDASYILDISKDELFSSIFQSFTLDAGIKKVDIIDLEVGETYFSRIKSISNQQGISDSEYASLRFVVR